LFAAPASAQDKKVFGTTGTIIISAERVSPLLAYQNFSTKSERNGVETTTSQSTTTMSLLASPNFDNIGFHTIPRLAFDFTVADNITVGGSIFAMFTLSAKTETKTGGVSQSDDSSKLSVFGIAPRVGYILDLGDTFAFWPRLGFSYVTATSSSPPRTTGGVTTESSSTVNQLALGLEGLFAIMPVRNFGITIGPVIDVPLTGKRKSETKSGGVTNSQEVNASQFHFGLTAGVLGVF
jgi:hypothetical protein